MESSNTGPQSTTPEEAPSVLRRLYSSPYSFTAAAFIGVLILVFGYMDRHIDPKLDSQSDDIKEAIKKIDNLSTSLQNYRVSVAEKDSATASTIATLSAQISNSQIQSADTNEQLSNLSTDIRTTNQNFQTKFAELQNTIRDEIKTVEEKTNTTEQRIEETIANLPEAETMVIQLDEQKTAIANADRDVNILKTLDQLGIEHPQQRTALQIFAESNPEFSENPEALVVFWDSKENFTNAKFAEHIKEKYTIAPTDALLLAYNELTEAKPILFFVEKREIQSNAEPTVGAAKPESEESEVPLAKPLTIARVCAEMKKPTMECYAYFLDLSNDVEDDVISFESPSDNAVMKLIIDKHEPEIPGE